MFFSYVIDWQLSHFLHLKRKYLLYVFGPSLISTNVDSIFPLLLLSMGRGLIWIVYTNPRKRLLSLLARVLGVVTDYWSVTIYMWGSTNKCCCGHWHIHENLTETTSFCHCIFENSSKTILVRYICKRFTHMLSYARITYCEGITFSQNLNYTVLGWC